MPLVRLLVVGSSPNSPAARLSWLHAETHPRVDAVHLTAPAVMAAGSVVTLALTLRQGTASVPIGWPVSAVWSSEGAVRFDPTTDRLTAVRPGSGRLTVVVNGVKASVTVTATVPP